MNSMDATRIELVSVNVLERALLKCPRIRPDLRVNDKTPSFDGKLYLYRSHEWRNNNIGYELPVQIKGKNKIIHSSVTNYQLEITYLQNFLQKGGCMFFLVAIDWEFKKDKIFYAALTPQELDNILKGLRPNQKTYNLHLVEFPKSDTHEMYNICVDLAEDCKRQHSIINADTKYEVTLADVLRYPDKYKVSEFSFSFSAYGVSVSELDNFLINRRVTLYAKSESWNTLLPLDKYDIVGVSRDCEGSVRVGEKVFYSSFTIQTTENGETYYRIGKSIRIPKLDHEKNVGQVDVELSGTLQDYINDLTFFVAFLEEKTLSLGETEYTYSFDDEDILTSIKSQLTYFRKIDLALQPYGVANTLCLDNITQIDKYNLHQIVSGIVDGRCLNFSGVTNTDNICIAYGTFTIANVRIMLWLERNEEGSFFIKNFFDQSFSPRIDCVADNGDKGVISRYVLLKKESFLELTNLNLSVIYSDICKQPQSSLLTQRTQHLMLAILSAYDELEQKDSDLLKLAEDLCTYIDNAKYPLYEESQVLNRYQIKKRKACLEFEDKRELVSFTGTSYPFEIRCGACLLLDEKEKAQEYFDQMEIEKQNEFLTYPICKFGNLTQKHEVSDSRIAE